MSDFAIDNTAVHTPVQRVDVTSYCIPTDAPESDGTLCWDATTLVLVKVHAADTHGLGYSYADRATALVIHDTLAAVVVGREALDVPEAWQAMVHAIRNLGRPGIASMAIAAVDIALWDLKAKLLQLPLARLLGRVRESIPVYGSGGFTSYDRTALQTQLGDWADAGIARVKMKVGREPDTDVERVAQAREAIGKTTELFVDANGAYDRKQALALADAFAVHGVCWFEEPVSSDDLVGLHLIRDRAPAGMDITAGEYGYDAAYFRHMLAADAVDVLQIDATRCAGITGFMRAAALCQAHGLPLSAHCAPSVHAPLCCAALPARHLEYFHDHVRIEHMLFEGALSPDAGMLQPDDSRPGLGLDFKAQDARAYEN